MNPVPKKRGPLIRMTGADKLEVREMFEQGIHVNNIHRMTGWSAGTLYNFRSNISGRTGS